MNAAFCSCRHTIVSIEEDFSVSKTLSIFAPGMPNTCLTPCRCSDSTTISAPDLGLLVLIPYPRDSNPPRLGGNTAPINYGPLSRTIRPFHHPSMGLDKRGSSPFV